MWPQFELGESRVWAGARGVAATARERACSGIMLAATPRQAHAPDDAGHAATGTVHIESDIERVDLRRRCAACAECARDLLSTCTCETAEEARDKIRDEARGGRDARSDHRRVRGRVRARGARRPAEHGASCGRSGRAGRRDRPRRVRARTDDAAWRRSAHRPQARRAPAHRPAGRANDAVRRAPRRRAEGSRWLSEAAGSRAARRARRSRDGRRAPRRTRPSARSVGRSPSACRSLSVVGAIVVGLRGERRLGAPRSGVGRARRDDRAALGQRAHAERRRPAPRRPRGARGARVTDVDALAERSDGCSARSRTSRASTRSARSTTPTTSASSRGTATRPRR